MINLLRKKARNTPYTSNNLFHFVGHLNADDHSANYDVLLKVLNDECISHPPHENGWGTVSYTINWQRSLLDEKLIIPTVTCFADIPLESLGIHVKKYGKFGLSFKREFLIKFGARPVMYFPLSNFDLGSPNGKELIMDIEATYKGFQNQVIFKNPSLSDMPGRTLAKAPENEDQAISQINNMIAKDFIAFIKPFDSHLHDDHPDNFYMEREWRKFGNLKFTPRDIENIIVAKDYSSHLQRAFPYYEGKIEEV